MHRATKVYILFAVALIAGTWLILSVGSRYVHAATDIAGTWAIAPDGKRTVHIEQSGQFIEMSVDNGPTLQLLLSEDKDSGDNTRHLVLTNSDQRIELQSQQASDNYSFNLGDGRERFLARRTQSTYAPVTEDAAPAKAEAGSKANDSSKARAH